MITSIHKYRIAEYQIPASCCDCEIWNGKSISDNGWFYSDIYRHIISTNWAEGMMATIINPDFLSVFEADEADDYSNYGFVKYNNLWIRT